MPEINPGEVLARLHELLATAPENDREKFCRAILWVTKEVARDAQAHANARCEVAA